MPQSIELFTNPKQLRAYLRGAGRQKKIGFVPTMGALHLGHESLLQIARERCDLSVLSIFVNPTQFGPNEDFARYPRTFEDDLAIAARAGVDVVFAPSVDSLYPQGFSTYVVQESLTEPLCGAFRPGHFRGVTTIVLKLLNLVMPDEAWFGLKDAQQFFVLSQMARDLDLSTEIWGAPTIREHDGLAMSSRNRYLSAQDRALAPRLAQVLNAARARLLREPGSSAEAVAAARSELTCAGFDCQYLELRSTPRLDEIRSYRADAPAILAAAAYLGTDSSKPKTRLIDNVLLRPDLLSQEGIHIYSPRET